MDRNQSANRSGGARRLLACLVVLAGIPLLIVTSLAWCHLLFWLISLIRPHLSGFLANFLSDFWEESGLVALAGTAILYLCGTWIAERSEKIVPTRGGARYLAAAAVAAVLAALGCLSLIRNWLPIPLPYQPDAGIMINLIYAMAAYAFFMVKAVFDMRKRKKQRPEAEHICIFCYTEKVEGVGEDAILKSMQKGYVPFCCVTGGPALVNENGSREVPGRNGMKLDLELFNRIKAYIYREERVASQRNWLTVNAFDGYIVGDKAVCTDLIQVYPNNGDWYYADLLSSPRFGRKAVSFALPPKTGSSERQLPFGRHYRFEKKGSIVPCFLGKTPREQYEHLIEQQNRIAASLKSKSQDRK